MSDILKRLDSFKEYAVATKKFADAAFYGSCAAEIESLRAQLEREHDSITLPSGIQMGAAMVQQLVVDNHDKGNELVKLRSQLADTQRDLSSREYECTALREAIDRLKAQSGEAVAWMHPDHLDNADLDIPVRFTVQSKPWGTDSIPLFTSPQAAKVPEALVNLLEAIDHHYIDSPEVSDAYDIAKEFVAAQEGEK